jgi:hypothetical protein
MNLWREHLIRVRRMNKAIHIVLKKFHALPAYSGTPVWCFGEMTDAVEIRPSGSGTQVNAIGH